MSRLANLDQAVQIGLERLELPFTPDRLSELARLGEIFVEDLTYEGLGERVQDSLIPLRNSVPSRGQKVVIDIGGTNVRAAECRIDPSGKERWRDLLSCQVHQLNSGNFAKPLDRFCFSLFHSLSHHSGISDLDGLAVVWSNAMRSYELPPGLPYQGVGAKADRPQQLSTKGEFFMRDLRDGEDISAYFLSRAAALGIHPRYFVIANDVPFTLKYSQDRQAHGAIVASTGANGSLVLDGALCNPELGVQFKLPARLLSKAEQGADSVELQYLCSGHHLGTAMKRVVLELAEQPGCAGLRGLASALDLGLDGFTAPDLSALLSRDFNKLRHQRDPNLFSDQVCAALIPVARALEQRAASAAAGLAYLSVCNQVRANGEQLLVVVESSLARGMPNFRAQMEESIKTLSAGQVHLLFPDSSVGRGITTPMIGAAHALDGWISGRRDPP